MAPNSELGLQFSTTTAAIAAASDAAWHVLSLLLSLGHPALPDELASKCKLFYSTPDFILFLCSIPNSPLQLAGDQFVTISQTGFDAIAQYFANSVTMTTFLDLPQFVPRLLQNVRSNGVIRTYSRKRKRLTSEIDDFSVTRKRRFFQDFNVDKNLNKIVLSMPGAFQTIYGQGNISDGNTNKTVSTLPRVTSFLAFDCQKLEKVMCASSSFINYCPGRLDCETKNVDQGDGKMEDNFCSREELCYLPQTRCQTDFLFGGRFQNLLTTKLAEKIMISVPHPEISLIPCLTDNSEVSKCDEMNIINPITNINHSNPCWLEVEQKMIFSQAEGVAQPCGLLIENVYRNTEEVLPLESDNCLGLSENLPLDKSHIDKYHTDVPGKTEANNVVLSPNRTRTEVHMQSHGDMLQDLVKSSSAPYADQKDATSRKKEGTCQTMENMKCIGPLKEEPQTFRRDKKPIAVKQKTKCNADLHIKSKGKRETSMENRKNTPSTSINNHNEQKPFPKFESYIVQEEEGSGGYGTVYRARRKSDGVTFAIKCPHVNAHRNIVHNEMKMLERLGGKNFVIKYEGSIKSGSSDCLVLEHVEHDRPEALKREINIFQLQWYGYCLFKALASLHKQSIVHRDVKPGNFLFSRTVNKGYLIDFNLALDLNRKHGSIDDRKAGHDVNFDHSPIPRTKSLPPAKERKFTNTSVPEAAHQNARKGSKSLLPPGNLKKKADKANVFTNSSSRNIIRAQGTDGSVITSTKDATSTRTRSAERLREPVPCQGRKELISLVQEALQGGNNESVNAPTSKRKRVAAPPRNAESNFFYPTPMPLHARGMAIGSAGILKSNGKHKREGPCVGTKGFRAPEVLFRSLYQGPKVDIWSAGVTLLYLIIGRTPFFGDPDENIKEIAKLRGSEDLWEVAKLHNHESLFPTDLLDVKYLSALKLRDWCVQNTRRPDFLEAIPKSLFDLVDKCLTVNPRLRINAEEALRHEFFTPCHEALRKQRLQRQGHSLETGTSRLLVRRESQSSEWLTQKSGQLENTQAPRNILHP